MRVEKREGWRTGQIPSAIFMAVIKLGDRHDLVSTDLFVHGSYPFEHFNRVQSRVFEIHDKDCNCVIAAPTGVGKTICAEMFMADEVRMRKGKAIYLAPLRALAKEKIDEWTSEKSVFAGLNVAICTGDYRLTDARLKELENSDVIIMTSEMLSSRCRNMDSEKSEFIRSCGTIVVDESHLLTVPGRGDHLEVGLMKFSQMARDPRIVFLSATMPNVDEIANWIACSLVRKETYLICSDYRPCPLEIHYEEYESGENYDQTEDYKVSKVVDLVKEYSKDKFIVFVHSKATGERVLRYLEERGVKAEFHNANIDREKRQKVEGNFKHGDLRVLVATSTLAWGTNNPARRVIITGVHRGTTEVENYDITQMAGRAGRPGFDTRGDAHILLPDKNYEYHVERISEAKKIESQLLHSVGKETPRYKTLAFHLVSEIHHGNVSTKNDIHRWYEKSLAYFQYDELDDSIVDQTLDLLVEVGAIRELNSTYEATSVGKVSSIMYYSPFDVADLRRNFKYIFSSRNESNDFALSWALGNVDSIRSLFVSKSEKEEMESFSSLARKELGDQIDSVMKGSHAYYCLMNGMYLGSFASFASGLKMDFDRLASVLNMLDSMAAKWNKAQFFKLLSMRISYGVRSELVDLCSVPEIGKARAEKLYAAGFRTAKDIHSKIEVARRILNIGNDKFKKIIESFG